MNERRRFVARRLEGEKMSALCAEFGISRKTGYKIFNRYQACGVEGLTDRSRHAVHPRRPERALVCESCRLEPIANPFGSKVLPMSPE